MPLPSPMPRQSFPNGPRRGELWWVQLDPTVGAEIKKTRPCLVISGNVVNRLRRTVVVIPLSSSPQSQPPIMVALHCQGQAAVAVIDRLRVADGASAAPHAASSAEIVPIS